MSRYRVAPQAREDIKEIYRYIKAENPSAAQRVRLRLYEKFRLLATQPYVGWVHPQLPGASLHHCGESRDRLPAA